jgi:hypothetical protein
MTNNPSSLPSPDSQRTPSKGLAKVLERARADILQRLEKYPFDWDSFDIRLKREEEVKECYESIQSIFLRYPEVFIIDFKSLFFQEPGEAINIDREALTKLFETVFTTATINQLEKFFSVISPIYIKDVERALGADSEIESTYLEIEYEKYLLAKQGLNRLEFSEENSSKNNNMERKHIVEQEVEAARSQLEKECRVGIKKIVSSNVSTKKKVDLLNKTGFVLHEIFDASQKGISVEEPLKQILQALRQKKGEIFLRLPKPGEDYPRYPGETDALAWLEKHWGKFLKYFNQNLDRDYLYQDQLGKLDSKLLQALKGQITYKKKKGEFDEESTLGDFVPPKKKRVDLEAGSVSAEDIKEACRLGMATRRRQGKQKKTVIFQKR